MTDETQLPDEPETETMNSHDRLELIQNFEPTDEECERLADYEKPNWAKRDFNSWAVACVVLDEDDERDASMNRPRAHEGDTRPNWKDSVLFTVGAGAHSSEKARENVHESRILAMDGLEKEIEQRQQLENISEDAHTRP